MQKILSKIATKIINKFNLYNSPIALESALERCQFRQTHINTVIDIGASDGRWSEIVRKYFPEAFYYLIEANQYHTAALEKLKSKWKNYAYSLAAAGDTVGEIFFDNSDPFGGLASHEPTTTNSNKTPVVTVDYLVEQQQLSPPYLLKLDTHGFEVPIFEGAAKTLQQTNLIIVEVYNFDIAKNSKRFYQICQYLEEKGFRCIDMCEPLFRPQDRGFWQIDLFFIPTNSPNFTNSSWN